MPFKSEAQRNLFREMVKSGKISQKTYDEWNKETGPKIPSRVGKTPTSGYARPVQPVGNIKPKKSG